MQAEIRENATTHGAWCVIHPLSAEDSAAMTALRSAVAGMKGKLEGTAARGPFNGIMERVVAPGNRRQSSPNPSSPSIKKAFANPIGTMWRPLITRFTASKSSVRELMR
jgi:hypothetical protein